VVYADERVVGSLADENALRAATQGVDAVVHLAGVTHARRASSYFDANVTGTQRLVDAANAAHVDRFVLVSTRSINRGGGAYSRSKADAEEILASSALVRTIVRLPELYGAAGSEGLDRIIERARLGKRVPVVGDGDDEICPMYLDDAVAACIGGLEHDEAAGKTYTLGGNCMSTRVFAEHAIRLLSSASTVATVPTSVVRIAGLVAQVLPLPLYPDQLARLKAPKPAVSPEAQRELGFSYRSLKEGLQALVTAET
jgi:NADH dehydrogenase